MAVAHFAGFSAAEGEGVEAEDRDVVLEVAGYRAEFRDFFFDVGDFVEKKVRLEGDSGAPV